MKQTKKQSFLEAVSNTAVGFVISLIASFIFLPMVRISSSPKQNIMLTILYTVLSILRGYVIRRWFNKKHSSVLPDIVEIDFDGHLKCQIQTLDTNSEVLKAVNGYGDPVNVNKITKQIL